MSGNPIARAVARICIGLAVFAVTLAVWRAGVWFDSLMTVRTPLYYQFQGWASLVVSAAAGTLAAVWPLAD
jgi:hypothetical protein